MNRRRMPGWRFFAVCVLMLSGCDSNMKNAIDPYIGQNIDLVLNRVGQPTSSGPAMGGTMYTWRTRNSNGGCIVNLYTSGDGRLRTWDSTGTQGGPCAAFAAQLRTGIGFMGTGDMR